jgi:hypothetical protein
MHPWFAPVLILLSISFPSSAYHYEMLQGPTHLDNFFSILKFSGHTPLTFSETSNYHTLCCVLNHGNILVQLLHCLCYPVSLKHLSQLLHSCSCCIINRVTWLGIICHFWMSLREFLDLVVNCATNISHHTQETFLYEYLSIRVLLHIKKCTTECCSPAVHPSSMITI